MNLDDLITQSGEWLKGSGPHSDIVLSTRVRLARNLAKMPFTNRATKKQLQAVMVSVEEAVKEVDYFKNATVFPMTEMDNVDKEFLVERHLMSHEHAAEGESKSLIVSQEEILSVMINEEDHLRVQVLNSGLNLFEAWGVINAIDDRLAEKLAFAFSPRWGYLTACPTNTGTAMRGSVMLHLPALAMTKQINKVLNAIAKLNFAARGFYGEGTDAFGNFYQISNQVSMGHSEDDILQNINGLIIQVIEQEEQARQALVVQNKPMLEDKIFRSLGVLHNARIISSQETLELLSMVRLGVDLGIVKNVGQKVLNELFIAIQPAHLQKIAGGRLSASARDIKRANLIRLKLGGKNNV
ncbi:MAG: protein arginine kinase [Candidatus Omnitrophota bacterium]